MNDAQVIILYILVTMVVGFIAMLVLEFIDEYKQSKKTTRTLRKRERQLQEEKQKQEFLKSIK